MQDDDSPQLPDIIHHLERVADCGIYAVLVQHQTPLGACWVRYLAKCGSRFCPECSRSKAQVWQKKIAGSFARSHCVMITLTFDSQAPDARTDPKYYSHAWDSFLKRLRRRYPRLRFARIVELHKSGRPHFHVLVNCYIPQKYVSWSFAECGGGKVADCRYVDPGRASEYITKYVTKSLGADYETAQFFYLTRMRSVNTSRGLYYNLPRVKAFAPLPFERVDIVDSRILDIIATDRYLLPAILFDDGHHPPFAWIPDPNAPSRILQPGDFGSMCWGYLQSITYDMAAVPADLDIYIYHTSNLSLEQMSLLRLS